jgi:hypothetical protein
MENGSPITFVDFLQRMKEWFIYLLRKWYLILAAAVLGGLAGVAKEHFTKPIFIGRTTFALEDNVGGMGTAASLAAEFGFNVGSAQSAFSGDNILQIFTSRNMVERTLLCLDSSLPKPTSLLNYYLSNPNLGGTLASHPRFKGVSIPNDFPRQKFSYLQDSLVFVVFTLISKRHLAAFKPDKKLSVYEIVCTSNDEVFSKHFVDKLMEQTTAFYTELKTKKSLQTLSVLQNRVAGLKGALNRSIGARASTQDANVNPAFSAAQVPVQRSQAEISTYAGAYEEMYKNLELALFQFQKDIPLLQVIDSPRYPLQKIKGGRLLTGALFGLGAVAIVVLLLILLKKPASTQQNSA